MRKIAFSVVGIGRIGNRHVEHIISKSELVSVCDIDPLARKQFADKYPDVKVYNSIEELLENDNTSEVVNICTPNGLHAQHTILALKAGKNVVCEKPMALYVKDCEEMIDLSNSVNKKLFIVKQNRFNPPVEQLKNALMENKLGKILSAQLNCFWNRNNRYYQESNWKGTKNLDGGILYTQFSHFLDLLLWFLGDVKEVSGYCLNVNHKGIIEFEDTLLACVKFESGVLASINCSINSYETNMEGSVTILGEYGTVKVGGQYLNLMEYNKIKDLSFDKIVYNKSANDYGFYQGSMSNHDKVIENVIATMNNRSTIAVDGLEGMRTIKLIEMLYNNVKSL